MNPQRARELLIRYRPGSNDESDPELAEALALAKSDPVLEQWLELEADWHEEITDCFRQIDPPPGLKQRILATARVPEIGPFWRNLFWWLLPAAAALAMVFLWLRPARETPNRFSDFRTRMVRIASREYRMDYATNGLEPIRRYLAEHSGHANIVLNSRLEKLPALGCAAFKWHNQPVAMICFDRGPAGLAWLFVVHRNAVSGAPDQIPELAAIGPSRDKQLATASWSAGTETYLLAMPGQPEDLRRLLEKY